MKRLLTIGMILTFMAGMLCACTNTDTTKEIQVEDVCTEILSKVKFDEEPQLADESVALALYNIDQNNVEEFRVYMTSGAYVDEVSVWKSSNRQAVTDKIRARIAEQKDSYLDYKAEEVPKLDQAVIYESGDYVVCCITSDAENAKQVIESCFNG